MSDWLIVENRVGLPAIDDVDSSGITFDSHPAKSAALTAARVYPGTIVKADSPTYGEGEFIYLPMAATQVIGSLLTYDPVNLTGTMAPNTANLDQPVAVSMAAYTAPTSPATVSYAWCQIAGAAVIKKTGVPVSPNVVVYLSGTAGRVKSTAASGKQIMNARTVNAATVVAGTSTITVLLQRPFAQGQTT